MVQEAGAQFPLRKIKSKMLIRGLICFVEHLH